MMKKVFILLKILMRLISIVNIYHSHGKKFRSKFN